MRSRNSTTVTVMVSVRKSRLKPVLDEETARSLKIKSLLDSGCTLCDLHKECQRVCMKGTGRPTASIVCIGEAPGAKEDEAGLFFCGQAGQRLNSGLRRCGLDRVQVAVENVCRCRPPENRKPRAKEIKSCSEKYLFPILDTLQPRVIILLGNVAMKAVIGKTTISQHAGSVYWSKRFKCKVIPTYHPSYIIREERKAGRGAPAPKVSKDFDAHLALARMESATSTMRLANKGNYRYVHTISELRAFLKRLEDANRRGRVVSMDVETGCLPGGDRRKSPIQPFSKHQFLRTVAFCFGQRECWCLDIESSTSAKRSLISKTLQQCDRIKYVGHNLKFDALTISTQLGVLLKPEQLYFCTMIAHHVAVDERRGLQNLSSCVSRFTSLGNYDWKIKSEGFGGVTKQELMEYNCFDADACYQLFVILSHMIADDKQLRWLWTKVSMPLMRLMFKAENHGMAVDRGWMNKASIKLTKVQEEAERRFCSHASVVAFEAQKGVSFSTLVQGRHPMAGRKLLTQYLESLDSSKNTLDYTEKGNLSLSAESLARYAKLHKSVSNLRKWRRCKDWLQIIESYEAFADDTVDDRIHASFNEVGTSSGRIASNGPNVQNLTGTLRPMIVPVRDEFVHPDYSQIELRFLAHCSKDSVMVQSYQHGVDLHAGMAAEAFNVHPGDVTDEQRKIGKTLNFSIVYGLSPDSLAVRLGVSVPEAERFISATFRRYSQLGPFKKSVEMVLQRNRVYRSVFGRFRHMPDGDLTGHDLRAGFNFVAQGPASTLTQYAAVTVDRVLSKLKIDAAILNIIHDSFLIDCFRKDRERIMSVCKKVMENLKLPFKMRVPLVADVEVGENYGVVKSTDDADAA